MNRKQALLNKQVPEVLCMQLPLMDEMLLVPTVSIAEMASLRPFDKVDNTPDWFLGFYTWRGLSVPVVAFESLSGGVSPRLTAHGRVAILNNTGANSQLPFIGILTQNIPRMARVEESDISVNTGANIHNFDLMAVKFGSDSYKIPNISAIENAYLQLGIQAPSPVVP